MTSTLYAGAARRVINPRLGTGKPGLRLFGTPIEAIERDLTATALVAGDGETRVALIALDLCMFSTTEALELRSAIARALEIPVPHVMLNLSHNHSAPALPGFMWMTDLPWEAAFHERYKDDLERWLVEAALEAADRAQPARLGVGWGESRIGVYRREFSEGSDVLGEVPEHPIDSSVGVARIDDLDGTPIAILFRYSAHPVTIGPRAVVASADYPGPAREVVEKSLGGLSLFLQGCCGNVNPAVGIGYEIDCADTKNRVGQQLGGEVVKVAASIRTNRSAGARTSLGSVPNILFTPLGEWVDGSTCEALAGVEDVVALEFDELPPLEQAQAIHERWKAERWPTALPVTPRTGRSVSRRSTRTGRGSSSRRSRRSTRPASSVRRRCGSTISSSSASPPKSSTRPASRSTTGADTPTPSCSATPTASSATCPAPRTTRPAAGRSTRATHSPISYRRPGSCPSPSALTRRSERSSSHWASLSSSGPPTVALRCPRPDSGGPPESGRRGDGPAGPTQIGMAGGRSATVIQPAGSGRNPPHRGLAITDTEPSCGLIPECRGEVNLAVAAP